MLNILEGHGRGGSHKKKGQNVMRSKTALVQNYRDGCAVVPCIAHKKMANEVLRYYWILSWQLPVVAVLVHRRLGFLEMLSSRVLLRLTREKMVTSLLSSSQHSARHTDSSWTTIKRTRCFFLHLLHNVACAESSSAIRGKPNEQFFTASADVETFYHLGVGFVSTTFQVRKLAVWVSWFAHLSIQP